MAWEGSTKVDSRSFKMYDLNNTLKLIKRGEIIKVYN